MRKPFPICVRIRNDVIIPLSMRGQSPKPLPWNARKRLRRHGKRLGKIRLRDFQPLNHMEHGLLPAERPKVSFVAAFSAPRMRASVSSVVLYFGMLKYAGTVPQVIFPWCFTPECLSMRGQSPKPFKTSTTECSETPSATRKAAGEKTSSRYPAAICSPTNGTWTLASGMPEGVFRCCHLCPANEGFCSW